MSDIIQILIAKYQNAADAEVALKKVHVAKTNQGIEVEDAAVVSRTAEGKLHIHETEDVTTGRGAAVGGVLGGVLGIFAGPAGLVAGAALGAAVGGAAARAFDSGIPHKRLEEIGASLPTNGAALVILTEAGFIEFIESVIGGRDIEVHTVKMDADAARRLGHDHDVALKALNLGEALAGGGTGSPVKGE